MNKMNSHPELVSGSHPIDNGMLNRYWIEFSREFSMGNQRRENGDE